jgi:hypothetical protein
VAIDKDTIKMFLNSLILKICFLDISLGILFPWSFGARLLIWANACIPFYAAIEQDTATTNLMLEANL